MAPFYNDINIDGKSGVRQGDTTSPKLFTAALQNVIRTLEWVNMGVKIDGRKLHHDLLADDIVFITPNISQAKRMLADFDKARGKTGLLLFLTKNDVYGEPIVSVRPIHAQRNEYLRLLQLCYRVTSPGDALLYKAVVVDITIQCY
ncbi:unnamed protein product [Angiostrongylus costaricensis]|uniref:Reverse transcriptase domain-containing protein n=1 Tax=Angiostrongylus costaricensis TaxID=334426 RepID=A0A0R3PXM2_ANGCS|nr:unnamed protein product [Angiostrongylus costaricensis]